MEVLWKTYRKTNSGSFLTNSKSKNSKVGWSSQRGVVGAQSLSQAAKLHVDARLAPKSIGVTCKGETQFTVEGTQRDKEEG